MQYKVITQDDVESAVDSARESARGRVMIRLDAGEADPVQRFVNAFVPRTYAQPHRHREEKSETFVWMGGDFKVILFDDTGMVTKRFFITCSKLAATIPGNTWHTVVCLSPGALHEVKQGPYDSEMDKELASWAPSENSPDAPKYLEWLRTAIVGQKCPFFPR